MNRQKISDWHHTRIGWIIFGLAEAGLAYGFASLAIPSAHTWEWFLAAMFGLGTVHNFGLLIGNLWTKNKRS